MLKAMAKAFDGPELHGLHWVGMIQKQEWECGVEEGLQEIKRGSVPNLLSQCSFSSVLFPIRFSQQMLILQL